MIDCLVTYVQYILIIYTVDQENFGIKKFHIASHLDMKFAYTNTQIKQIHKLNKCTN